MRDSIQSKLIAQKAPRRPREKKKTFHLLDDGRLQTFTASLNF